MKSVACLAVALWMLGSMCGSAAAQRQKSTLLPPQEARSLADQCSRTSPPKFEETWQPTPSELRLMESRFSRIKELRAEGCCQKGQRIDDPERFHMQYAGLVVQGRKLIYLNAFAAADPPKLWKEQAVIVCDGGLGFWGVLYDPETGKFFDLAINGEG